MDNTWLPTLITGCFGVIGVVIQEILKRRKEDYFKRGLHKPVPIGAKEKRNSIKGTSKNPHTSEL
jgi:hypothetical protein